MSVKHIHMVNLKSNIKCDILFFHTANVSALSILNQTVRKDFSFLSFDADDAHFTWIWD